MELVIQEGYRSNMTKVGGHKREDGKWVKPPTYSPASVAPLLTAQRPFGRLEDHQPVEVSHGEADKKGGRV